MTGLRALRRLWRALPLSDHTRWQITARLLGPLLPLLEGSRVHRAYLLEKQTRERSLRPFHGDAFPPLPPEGRPDVFLWGVIDWHLRIQRPQHLARGLAARGHRVFYISPSFVRDRRPGFEVERVDDGSGAGVVYCVRLHLDARPRVYANAPRPVDHRRLREDMGHLLEWTRSRRCVAIVQHPWWRSLARHLPNSTLVYDCLDHQAGFSNTTAEIADLEAHLLKESDAVVATSQFLHDLAARHHAPVALVRNAVEYDRFAATPATVFRDERGRQVIGYYGAIADWLDLALIEAAARALPECLMLLIGADTCGAQARLAHLPNVRFTGEVAYHELPYYLHGMDVCLLPFRVTPLTLATNPLKVYEYLAAGKPVVAVRLPEIAQFGSLVAAADDPRDFVAHVRAALAAPGDAAARRSFAARNTWSHRVDEFERAIAEVKEPRASVIVVTYNNLELTRACLDSLVRDSDYPNLEIIVVDNASTDGTPAFLREWREAGPARTVVLNADNRGFAAANNQGLAVATGDYLVLLNNDTQVTPGWLRTLMNHLKADASIGMVGPVTNNIGNEARIAITYRDPDDMVKKAAAYTRRHFGMTFPIRTLAFFCVMLRRRVYETVGPLDEAYGLGFFEDDDYCRRLEQAGWRAVCAEDVFVHHHLSASFGKLGPKRQELLDRNRRIYEAKWGKWVPHQYR